MKEEYPSPPFGKVTKKRLTPEERKQQLVEIALGLAQDKSLELITAKQVTGAAGVCANLIQVHFGNMPNFRNEVMQEAISRGELEVIGHGITGQNEVAVKIPDKLKTEALNSIKGA